MRPTGASSAKPASRSSGSSPAASPSSGRSSARSSGSSRRPRRSTPRTSVTSSQLLPARVGATPLRHAMEVRHPSFMCPEYLALARRHGVATVFADSDDYPSFADATGDFVYARLMRCEAARETGYPPRGLATWAARAQGVERRRRARRTRSRRGCSERRRLARRLHVLHQRREGAGPGCGGGDAGRARHDAGIGRLKRQRPRPLARARPSIDVPAARRRDCGRTGRWRRRG